MADQFNYDVFLSHSSQDKASVRPLAERLRADGLRVWFDEWILKPGVHWPSKIEEGLEQSRVLVLCMSAQAFGSDWAQFESYAYRFRDPLNKEQRFVPLRLDTAPIKGTLAQIQYINWLPGEQDYAKLLEACRPPAPPLLDRRAVELAYLQRLQDEERLDQERQTKLYTQLDGQAQKQRPKVCAAYERRSAREGEPQAPQPVDNVIAEILRLRQAALLGEPGSGKTTTLWLLAVNLLETARQAPAAPLPLLIRLGRWTEAEQTLPAFMAAQLGELGAQLETLLKEQRAALLLDGLNELPVSQRKSKYPQVQWLIKQNPQLLAVISCRELDYKDNDLDLGFDVINIKPLDPPRMLEFVQRDLGDELGERMFWDELAKDTRQTYQRFMQEVAGQLAEPEQTFWNKDHLPPGVYWGWKRRDEKNDNSYWENWLKRREEPSGLMLMARNPYLLSMLDAEFEEARKLPDNRGDLFRAFVNRLLKRECDYLTDEAHKAALGGEHEILTQKLAELAFAMQIRRNAGTASDAWTALPKAAALDILTERQLRLAGNASILSLNEPVRFSHQLLQEYFAAQFMDIRFRAGELQAEKLWPRTTWWQRTNWEEAAVLWAGLKTADCSQVVEWIAAANPEVAAQCVVRSGAHTPDATRERLRTKWLDRLDQNSLNYDSQPQARAAVGRALGQTRLDNRPLDNRPGVGLNSDGLPDITWIEIPDGEFQYGAEKQADDPEWYKPAKPQLLTLSTFWISRYPITYAQFRCFAEDNGYGDQRWWEGLAADDDDRQPAEQRFKFDNHPRETVNWYEAIAFCRWLSWRKDGGYDLQKIDEWKVRLPTEFEWEKAARGPDGQIYPYEGKFDTSKGNVRDTGIGQTSAVGIFPDGKSFYGVEEMSGNVWEWCLSAHDKPQRDARKEKLDTDKTRVLRGGSWFDDNDSARAVIRGYGSPGDRDFNSGVRLAVVCPPS